MLSVSLAVKLKLSHIFVNGSAAQYVWCHFARIFNILILNASSVIIMFKFWHTSLSFCGKQHVRNLIVLLIYWCLNTIVKHRASSRCVIGCLNTSRMFRLGS
ncbi:hypothetical protein CDL12_10129 [Handroanthus impetiginosus]|uniref:Uncharacterized protein n=1 Tax=Handroanthus impetiginosus TaxID=429701 RepID=A0A2G9HI63_9LAMI|nr:hypothetical protein CDL12_10129 [Handroanthus impetiginosus]